MKIKQLLTKTLLVAAALLGGASSALGYVVPTGYEVKNVFVGTDNGDNTVTPENFSSGSYNSLVFGPGTCYHATASEKLKVVDYSYVALPDVGESVGDAPYPTYVGANGKVIQWHSRSNATQYGTITMSPVSTGKLVFGVDLNFGGYNTNYAPQIIFVDGSGNNVLQLGFNCGSGNTEYFQYKVNDGDAVNDGTVGSSKLRGKYTGHSIRDIVIDMETGDVVYTVDCIGTDGKRQVKTSTKGVNIGTGKTIAGVRLSRNFAQGSQSDYIWADNIELYSVGVETPSYTYTIKGKAGSTDLGTLATGSCKGGMSFSATGLPYVIKNGDDYYVLTDAGVSNFSKSYTMEADGSNKDQEIEYTLDNTIVFYSEIEDLGNHGGETAGNYSNGTNAYISGTKYSELAELSRGVYSVKAAVNDRPDRGMIIRSAQSIADENKLAYITSATDGIMSGEFSLYENTTAYLSGITTNENKINQSATMDYIVIRKTADIPTTVSTSAIPTSKYATISSAYALDFANATDGSAQKTLKAYTVSALSATSATLTEVTQAPANTGIILMGTAGETYTIPVLANASDVGTNKLHAAVTATTLADGSFYILKGGKFLLVTGAADEAARTVPAGKAYLLTSEVTAPSLTLDFGDITGIETLNVEQGMLNGQFFDLQGRKVAKPAKGLYIVNGKKVVIK